MRWEGQPDSPRDSQVSEPENLTEASELVAQSLIGGHELAIAIYSQREVQHVVDRMALLFCEPKSLLDEDRRRNQIQS